MRNLILGVAIVSLLAGIIVMLGGFGFEASLPAWTAPAAITSGVLLNVLWMLTAPRKPGA